METEYNDIKKVKRKKIFWGFVLLCIGGVLLAKQLGVIFPEWLMTWEMLLIVIGLLMGIKHGFRGIGWTIPIIIGGLFLVDNFMPEIQISNFIWPTVIILVGLLLIFGKHRPHNYQNCKNKKWERYENMHKDKYTKQSNDGQESTYNAEDTINSLSLFSGVKRTIVSKQFKGGDITNVFGGAEINFLQADFTGKVELEITQVFGGTKIIIPSNWTVRNEINPIMGGLEDNRNMQGTLQDPEKLLILIGTTVFGGIEINSY